MQLAGLLTVGFGLGIGQWLALPGRTRGLLTWVPLTILGVALGSQSWWIGFRSVAVWGDLERRAVAGLCMGGVIGATQGLCLFRRPTVFCLWGASWAIGMSHGELMETILRNYFDIPRSGVLKWTMPAVLCGFIVARYGSFPILVKDGLQKPEEV